MSKLKLGLLFVVYLVAGMQAKCSDSSSSEPAGLWYAMRGLSLLDKFYTVASIVTGQEWLMPEDSSPVNVTGLNTSSSSLPIGSREGKRRAMGNDDLRVKYQVNYKQHIKLETIKEVDEVGSEPE